MTKTIQTTLSQDQIQELKLQQPIENSYQKMHFPELGMLSQDETEESGTGKAKKIEVINAAGEFFIKTKEEVIEDGKTKNVYSNKYFDGETLEGIIVYHRKMLKMWDAGNKVFITTPIFDDENEIIPLFSSGKKYTKDGMEVKGNIKQLQSLFPAVSAKGTPTSKLKQITILYVLMDDKMYQMELSASSTWLFSDYKRNNVVPAVVTSIGSLEDTQGVVVYRKCTFKSIGSISTEQFETVKQMVIDIKDFINAEKEYFGKLNKPELLEQPKDITSDFALTDGYASEPKF